MSHPKNIVPIKKFVLEMYRSNKNKKLFYHGFHHILNVLEAANGHIKRLKINKNDAHLVRVAALLHDIGILWTYSKHEEEGVVFIKSNLQKMGYSKKEIEVISNMILATELPQNPKTLLEQIVCDSDLDYLGRDRFYEIGETLYKEFKAYNIVNNRKDWDALQIKFLENHEYHTHYARRVLQHKMHDRLKELKEKMKKFKYK